MNNSTYSVWISIWIQYEFQEVWITVKESNYWKSKEEILKVTRDGGKYYKQKNKDVNYRIFIRTWRSKDSGRTSLKYWKEKKNLEFCSQRVYIFTHKNQENSLQTDFQCRKCWRNFFRQEEYEMGETGIYKRSG